VHNASAPAPPLPSSVLATWASLTPSLASLRMPSCNVTGPLPCALPAAAPGLASLHLHGNRLTGPLPGACWAAYATQLRLLDLSNNAIDSTLPASWAPALAQLKLLYLQANQLHGSLPNSWGLLPELKLGDLSGNRLKLEQVPKLWIWGVCAKEDAFVCLERDERGMCARCGARQGRWVVLRAGQAAQALPACGGCCTRALPGWAAGGTVAAGSDPGTGLPRPARPPAAQVHARHEPAPHRASQCLHAPRGARHGHHGLGALAAAAGARTLQGLAAAWPAGSGRWPALAPGHPRRAAGHAAAPQQQRRQRAAGQAPQQRRRHRQQQQQLVGTDDGCCAGCADAELCVRGAVSAPAGQ
jgi:hypothetical protein